MQTPINSFWGKLIKDDSKTNVLEWHPLEHHCIDVAVCFEGLLNLSILGKRIATLAGVHELTAQQKERLVVLSAMHDLGKFNLGFQSKANAGVSKKAGHVTEFLKILSSMGNKFSNEMGNKFSNEFIQILNEFGIGNWCDIINKGEDGFFSLITASICHHGRPLQYDAGFPNGDIWSPNEILDPMGGIRNFLCQLKVLFPLAFESSKEYLPETAEFHHAFSGMVMLADWLGSDVKFFPYSDDHDLQRRLNDARKFRDSLFVASGLTPTGFRNNSTLPRTKDIARLLAFDKLNTIQSGMLEIPIQKLENSLTLLESDTGSGKTEAAFLHYLVLFLAGKVDGLYFALPTRTSAMQIYKRLCKLVKALFGNNGPPVSLAVPGYVEMDGSKGIKLSPFEVTWPDDENDLKHFRGWSAEHPKRYLSGSIIVGTLDQVLFSSLKVPHAHMRTIALFRLLLVIDEVHASDVYMTYILKEVLAKHLKAGGHALLMSATLGVQARHQFESILDKDANSLSFEDAKNQPYPAIGYQSESASFEFITLNRNAKSKEFEKLVRISLCDEMEKYENIASTALNAVEKGAKVLVLRNTVDAATKTQEQLERLCQDQEVLFRCAGKPVPHHARYVKEDRELLDAELEKVFGKNRAGGGKIVVSTQTIQQSLDLDFDFLITDLCPIDVLLQRIGRLHRHFRRAPNERPQEFRIAKVLVLCPQDYNLEQYIKDRGDVFGPCGISSFIYGNMCILEATRKVLENNPEIIIPTMNRLLVESGLHSEILEKIAGMNSKWQDHYYSVGGTVFAQRNEARNSIYKWKYLFVEPENEFSRLTNERIKTRLGMDTRRIEFNKALRTPLGKTFSVMDIPGHLCQGADIDAKPKVVSVEDEIISFSFDRYFFEYTTMGLIRKGGET